MSTPSPRRRRRFNQTDAAPHVESFQILVRLPGLDLEVAERPLVRLLLRELGHGLGLGLLQRLRGRRVVLVVLGPKIIILVVACVASMA